MNLELNIHPENEVLFKRTVRKLLDGTFLLREKEEKLYLYLLRPSNLQNVSDYLGMIGYDVFLDEKTELAMLMVREADQDTVGLRRQNLVSFTTTQYNLLLTLWEIYLEKLGSAEKVQITRGELIEKVKAYMPNLVSKDLKQAFKLFRKYNFIDFNDHDAGENAVIRLYSSLQFGWNLTDFRAIAEEMLSGGAEKEAEEESEEEIETETEEEDEE